MSRGQFVNFVDGNSSDFSSLDASDPVAIYQDIIDRLSHAALHGDVGVLKVHIRLPFSFATIGGHFSITTEAGLVAYCLSFTETLRQMRATDYIRLAREARFLGPDRIEGMHYTHIIRGTARIVAPYASRMVIEEKDSVWAVVQAAHAIENDVLPIRVPEVGRDGESPPVLAMT